MVVSALADGDALDRCGYCRCLSSDWVCSAPSHGLASDAALDSSCLRFDHLGLCLIRSPSKGLLTSVWEVSFGGPVIFPFRRQRYQRWTEYIFQRWRYPLSPRSIVRYLTKVVILRNPRLLVFPPFRSRFQIFEQMCWYDGSLWWPLVHDLNLCLMDLG